MSYWEPVLLKRRWIPEWFYRLFAWNSKIWGLQNAGGLWPWRWILHRKPTEFENRRFRVRIEE